MENPEKTANPKFYNKENMNEQDGQGLSDVISYAINSEKTQQIANEDCVVVHSFVSGVNCSPLTARDEMLAVKKRFGKENGTVAYHGYQSFAPGEATPEMAHEIGKKLAARLWGDRYQVIVATHLDKETHLHNHFVLNTVSFVDGIKYHRTKKDYYDMKKESDRLCREYSLSVIEKPQYQSQHGAWEKTKKGSSKYLEFIKADVDTAICQSVTEKQFFTALKKMGYSIRVGQDITVCPPGRERGRKLCRNFGEAYSIENIRQKILAQNQVLPVNPKPEIKRYKLHGNLKNIKKITGFRALYFHYCYLLGIFNRNKASQNFAQHLLRHENLQKLSIIAEQTRLLARCRIDTTEQLFLYKEQTLKQIECLAIERKELYQLRRTVTVKSDTEKTAEVKTRISAISKELCILRKEVKLCNGIAERSGIITEQIKTIRKEKILNRKERSNDEYVR